MTSKSPDAPISSLLDRLAFAFQQTTTKVITQRYFSGETLIGKTGRALVPMKATGKGVVHVEHESWSAVAEDDIARGESVIVTAVDPDNVTLKVRKHQA